MTEPRSGHSTASRTQSRRARSGPDARGQGPAAHSPCAVGAAEPPLVLLVLVAGGRDLPEIAVGVTEVPEVPPLRLLGFLHDAATGRLGLAHDLVHRFLRRDDEVERDTPESGSLGGDAGILRRLL